MRFATWLGIGMALMSVPALLCVADSSMASAAASKPALASIPVFDLEAREAHAPKNIQVKLAKMRAAISAKKHTYKVGYTTALDIPLNQLAGAKRPADAEQQIKARKAESQSTPPSDEPSVSASSSMPATYDLRDPGPEGISKVSPIRDQGVCGSCWTFSTIAAYESNFIKRNLTPLNFSEQEILNCTGGGGYACDGGMSGGWPSTVFKKLMSYKGGIYLESDFPYTAGGGVPGSCPNPFPYSKKSYQVKDWGHVGWTLNPTVEQVKKAIIDYGVLSALVFVTDNFAAYAGGVFNEPLPADWGVNHAINIIGWDDSKNAWLLRNSWGTGWGTSGLHPKIVLAKKSKAPPDPRGYMWIDYKSSNISDFVWVLAQKI